VLDLWDRFGGDFTSITEFCSALGPANDFNDKWVRQRRKFHPDFKNAMDAITAKREQGYAKKTESRAHFLAQQRWPRLDRWKGIWIERFRESFSRRDACEMVNRTWSKVEKELAADPAFAEAYEEINREFLAAIEDAQVRSAAQGKGGASANAILEVQSERFSKMRARQNLKNGDGDEGSLTNYDPKTVRAFAQELFRRTLPFSPHREGEDAEPAGSVAEPEGSRLAAS